MSTLSIFLVILSLLGTCYASANLPKWFLNTNSGSSFPQMNYVTYPFASPNNTWYYPGASIFKKEPTEIKLGSDAASNAIISEGAIYNSNSAITTVGKKGKDSNTEAKSLTQTQGLSGGLTSAAMARANRK